MEQLNTRQKGNFAEELAARYLTGKGFEIIKRNWYCSYGELDIVATQNEELVFIEVKYVSSTRFCQATDLFTNKKRKHLARTIRIYLKKNKQLKPFWRLDLLCMTYDRNKYWVEHYQNVLLCWR